MKLEKLQPGMIVYDVGRTKMGNTSISTVSVWPVRIVSIDLVRRRVIAVWNRFNPERSFTERQVGKWKSEHPKLVSSAFGSQRLATREERNAMKTSTQPTP